jgi:hypothetical protein
MRLPWQFMLISLKDGDGDLFTMAAGLAQPQKSDTSQVAKAAARMGY